MSNNDRKDFIYNTDHINVDNVNWTNIMEKNVKEIGEKAKGYKIMHIQQAHKVSKKYKCLMYLGICLGPLSALLSGIGATLNPDAPAKFPIASACAGFIAGIVVAITKFGKFEEKSSHHKIAASKYTSLESNIRRQLMLCRNNRVNAAKYIEWIGNSFDDLFMASPLIARKIYTKYVKIATRNGISIPDEYNLTIDINKQYQIQKLNEMKDITTIEINESNSDNEETNNKTDDVKIDIIKTQPNENTTFKGSTKIKRTDTLSNFPELNEFSDGRMGYEMRRMMGLK